jgi:hypothetical protein
MVFSVQMGTEGGRVEGPTSKVLIATTAKYRHYDLVMDAKRFVCTPLSVTDPESGDILILRTDAGLHYPTPLSPSSNTLQLQTYSRLRVWPWFALVDPQGRLVLEVHDDQATVLPSLEQKHLPLLVAMAALHRESVRPRRRRRRTNPAPADRVSSPG